MIGIICSFADFQTNTAIRSTCSAVRAYVPLLKVVGFEEFKSLVPLLKLDGLNSEETIEKKRIFQERIHLDLDPKKVTMEQVKYLNSKEFYFELSRIYAEGEIENVNESLQYLYLKRSAEEVAQLTS